MASVTIGSHILQQHKILSISFLQNKSPVLHEDQVQQPLILQSYGATHSSMVLLIHSVRHSLSFP